MPDQIFVQALSGGEIKRDLLAQIKKKLDGSCDLRDFDAYPRGYSATFSYHIECYGLDTAVVDAEINAGMKKSDPDTVVVEGNHKIDHEPELDAVRERSEQSEPVLARTAEGGVEVRQRRYARRVVADGPVEAPVVGGTQEFVE